MGTFTVSASGERTLSSTGESAPRTSSSNEVTLYDPNDSSRSFSGSKTSSGYKSAISKGWTTTPPKTTTSSTSSGATKTTAQLLAETKAQLAKVQSMAAQVKADGGFTSSPSKPSASNALTNLSVGLAQGQQISQADINSGALQPGGAFDFGGTQEGNASDDLTNLSIGLARQGQQSGNPATQSVAGTPEEQQVQLQQAQQQLQSLQAQQGGEQNTQGGGQVGQSGLALTGSTPLSNPSVVDFLNASGLASDFGSRTTLASSLGIPNYTGSTDQNTQMLNQLRAEQASANNIQSAANTPASPSSLANHEAMVAQSGTAVTSEMYQQNPVRSLGTYVTDIMNSLGMGEASVLIQKEADEIEKLENKRDKDIRDINDNPWLTEGVRLRQVQKAQEKYSDEIGNREAKLNRLQSDKQMMVQQAQWAMGTAISLWDSDRRFDATQAQNLYNQQQDALEWQYKQAVFTNGIQQSERDFAFKQQQAERNIFESDRAFGTAQSNADREFGLSLQKFEADQQAGSLQGVKFNQNQYQAATYATRASQAEEILSQGFYAGLGTQGDNVSRRQFIQAQDNFISAVLRKESGAAIGEDEREAEEKKYIPKLFDSQATLDQKARSREIAIQGLKNEGGGAYSLLQSQAGGGFIYESPSGNQYNLPN